MKKSLIFAAACLFAAVGFGNAFQAQADEPKAMNEKELTSLESKLFVTLDASGASDDAKAAQTLIDEGETSEGGDAKCWWWCCRPRYYYYPTYYYYSWYCPCYYVPVRLVTYTVPVTYTATIVSPTVAAVNRTVSSTSTSTTTSETSVSSTGWEFKASGAVAKGAVINGTVPEKSPLKKMGLRSGDIIVKVDGNKVDSLADVQRATANSKIVYIRGNQIKTGGKQILQKVNDDVTVKAFAEKVSAEQLEKVGQGGQTLYEYYDALEKDTVVK